MNYSGILVQSRPENTLRCRDTLAALQGTEVFQIDTDTGRLIVVTEAASIQDEVQLLKQIKKIPDVILAELIYHYFAEDQAQYHQLPSDIDDQSDQPTQGIPVTPHFNQSR